MSMNELLPKTNEPSINLIQTLTVAFTKTKGMRDAGWGVLTPMAYEKENGWFKPIKGLISGRVEPNRRRLLTAA
jgi:hypothetical protein